MIRLMAAVLFVLFSCTAAKAQEREEVFTFYMPFYKVVKETQESNLVPLSTYKHRAAPIGVRVGGSLTDSLVLDARFAYSKLGPFDNPPSFAFSNTNSYGKMINFEVSLGWRFADFAWARGGYSHDYLDRPLRMLTGFRRTTPVQMETTHIAPFFGVGAEAVDFGNLFLKGGVDFYPVVFHDDSLTDTRTRGTGYRTEGQVGYWFTDHLAAIVGAGYKKLKDDYQDKEFGAGIAFGF
jgi:hypothetical protein